MQRDLTDEQIDTIADAHRWDTREGRRDLVRAALASAPAAETGISASASAKLDACVTMFTEAEVDSIVRLRVAQFEQRKGPYADSHPQAQRAAPSLLAARLLPLIGAYGDARADHDASSSEKLAALVAAINLVPPSEQVAPAEGAPNVMTVIADIAHEGGLRGMSESEALVEIRRLTLPCWDFAGASKAPAQRAQVGTSDTVPIQEYRRVVARCIELGEKLAAGVKA